MESEELHKVAFSMVPGVNADVVRAMEATGVTLHDFFRLNMPELSEALGIRVRFDNDGRDRALFAAREELDFMHKHGIMAHFMTDEAYPALLRETPDAPVLLYVLGHADLNAAPAFNVVGTRRCTSYGHSFAQSLVADLGAYFPDCIVVSGLAFGIDAAAHVAALQQGIKTVAVLAHGLSTVYPKEHRDLARRILDAGGALVSEYPHGTTPYRSNFLQRNRIVAGMCELTFVVESEVKGGAMSTANLAFSYSREVFALPGRFNDESSGGCNALISKQKAHLFTSVANLLTVMGWKLPALGVTPTENSRNLFPELEPEAAEVYNFIRGRSSSVTIDEIHMATALPMPSLMGILTELEFEGILVKLPGSRYEIS